MGTGSQVPACETFSRVLSWLSAGFKAGGVELNMGSKLLPAFLNAGLPRPTMIAASRVESGPDPQGYDFSGTNRPKSHAVVGADRGAATVEEVAIDTLADRLRQEAVTNESVIFFARLVGA